MLEEREPIPARSAHTSSALEKVRTNGYEMMGFRAGVINISVPVLGPNGTAIATLTCPSSIIDPGRHRRRRSRGSSNQTTWLSRMWADREARRTEAGGMRIVDTIATHSPGPPPIRGSTACRLNRAFPSRFTRQSPRVGITDTLP